MQPQAEREERLLTNPSSALRATGWAGPPGTPHRAKLIEPNTASLHGGPEPPATSWCYLGRVRGYKTQSYRRARHCCDVFQSFSSAPTKNTPTWFSSKAICVLLRQGKHSQVLTHPPARGHHKWARGALRGGQPAPCKADRCCCWDILGYTGGKGSGKQELVFPNPSPHLHPSVLSSSCASQVLQARGDR